MVLHWFMVVDVHMMAAAPHKQSLSVMSDTALKQFEKLPMRAAVALDAVITNDVQAAVMSPDIIPLISQALALSRGFGTGPAGMIAFVWTRCRTHFTWSWFGFTLLLLVFVLGLASRLLL